MAALPALRPVACVAGLNAATQGLIGIALSVLALTVCFCGLGTAPQAQANDFAQYLTYYLQGQECGGSSYGLYRGVTTPMALRVWMALSLFFSATMMISSIVLVIAVARQWSDEKLQITLVSWLFINCFTAIDDVVLGYVFGNDYFTAQDSTSQEDNVGPFTLAIVTLLSVRGIYLWLINLAFIVYLFTGAQSLHKYLNEQVPAQDQDPIESWPTLDEFGKSKELERTPTAVNPRVAERIENGQGRTYPKYSAMGRWPSLNGPAQTVIEPRPERTREVMSKTVREFSFRRQEGIDNPAYEIENKYYLRLQSDVGSTHDYEEYSTDPATRTRREDSRNHLAKREISTDSAVGHYKQKSQETWNDKPVSSQSLPEYPEEPEVTIPPVDYLETQPGGVGSTPSTSTGYRPQSLQEAILDRTLRLKKVPEQLRKGLQK